MDGSTLAEKLAYWRATKRAPGSRVARGTMRYVPVQDDHNGSVVGHHLEHWSGRVDATVEATLAIPLARVNPPSVDRPPSREPQP